MKELIIIVYKINVAGLTYATAEQQLQSIKNTFALRNDDELKENYIVREIFLPITQGITDVKIIYPIPRYNITRN